MLIVNVDSPVWGQHYDRGWIGFVHHHSFIAAGIWWFTKWWRKAGVPPVSHVLVVGGPDSCIEAQPPTVQENPLSNYFKDKRYTVYFRKPVGWTFDLGNRIAAEARKYVGTDYGENLLVADAASYSIVGRILNGATADQLDSLLTKIGDSPKTVICDKLAVLAMQVQAELQGKGTLIEPARKNNPQKLFGDEQLFYERVYAVTGKAA